MKKPIVHICDSVCTCTPYCTSWMNNVKRFLLAHPAPPPSGSFGQSKCISLNALPFPVPCFGYGLRRGLIGTIFGIASPIFRFQSSGKVENRKQKKKKWHENDKKVSSWAEKKHLAQVPGAAISQEQVYFQGDCCDCHLLWRSQKAQSLLAGPAEQ